MNETCERCGALLPPAGGFCTTCGHQVAVPSAETEAAPAGQSGRKRGLIIGAAVIAGALVLGLGAALALGGSGGEAPVSAPVTVPATPSSPTPAPTSAAPEQSWVPATSLPGGELPTAPTVAAQTYAVPSSVGTTIAGQSNETVALAVVNQYIGAINSSRYSSAYDLTTSAWQDSHSYSKFVDGYDTTTISNVDVTDSTSAPTVDVVYQSNQSSSDGPGGATCLIWTLRYEFAYEGGQYRISKIKELADPPYRRC